MDFNEVAAAVVAAVRASGGEMLYQDFQDTLPPVVQLSLPRHFNQMRADGTLELAVRFDAETVTTGLFISVPKGGGK